MITVAFAANTGPTVDGGFEVQRNEAKFVGVWFNWNQAGLRFVQPLVVGPLLRHGAVRLHNVHIKIHQRASLQTLGPYVAENHDEEHHDDQDNGDDGVGASR